MESKTQSRRELEIGAFLGLALLAALTIFTHIADDDQWWHILTGRWILDTGTIPFVDPFSFTYHGRPWVQWEWLSGVLAALAWDGGGAWGLILLRGLALSAFLGLLARQLWTTGDETPSAAPVALTFLLAAVLLVVLGRLGDRPHFYMLPLFAGLSLLCERMRHGIGRRELLWLAVIFTVWTGLHPSWILGLGLLGAAALDRLFDRQRPLKGREFLAWLSAGMLALALVALSALLLNPEQFGEALKEIFAVKVSAEWDALSKHLGLQVAPTNAFLVLCVLWLFTLPWWFKRRAYGRLALSAACVWMAFLHVRFTVEASILMAPMIAPRLLQASARLATPRSARLALCAVVAIALALLVSFEQQQKRSFGVGLDLQSNPVSQADFMQRHGLGGRIFATTKEAHGYLAFRLWPAAHVFIDGRVPQLFPQSFLDLYSANDTPERLKETLRQWQVEQVVLSGGLFTPSSEGVGRTLLADDTFALVYFDETGAVFCRRGPACRRQPAFTALNPWAIDNDWPRSVLAQTDKKTLASELLRLNELAPEHELTRALQRAFSRAN